MPEILVIADDLSGAAELAGLGLKHGLPAIIAANYKDICHQPAPLSVLELNSRNMTPIQAYSQISDMLSDASVKKECLVYKKVDSVLRGPVVSEIKGVMQAFGYESCCLIPANPSRNRVIRSGKYIIDGIPISHTAFLNDSDYPRTADDIEGLVIDHNGNLVVGGSCVNLQAGKIVVPDIGSVDDIRTVLYRLNPQKTLLAGGSDFFSMVLKVIAGLEEQRTSVPTPRPDACHFLIGSRTDTSRQTFKRLEAMGYQCFEISSEAIHCNDAFMAFCQTIVEALSAQKMVAVSTPEKDIHDPVLRRKATDRLAMTGGEMCRHQCQKEAWLCIEGGETASAFWRACGAPVMTVDYAWEEGAALMNNPTMAMRILVKPGSYAWPETLFV